jgi:hypothetical protein
MSFGIRKIPPFLFSVLGLSVVPNLVCHPEAQRGICF